MAGFDDITKRASEFLNSGKAQDALKSEKAEGISDKILDGVAGFANSVTGGKHSDKIESAREAVDNKIGTDGTAQPESTTIGTDGTPQPESTTIRTDDTVPPAASGGGLRGSLIDPKP